MLFTPCCLRPPFLHITGIEAVSATTYVPNLLPTKTCNFDTPHHCKCYLNLLAAAAHKLSSRSSLCVLLGYSAHHKGYCCLDLTSNNVIISLHITSMSSPSPFRQRQSTITSEDLDLLGDFTGPSPCFSLAGILFRLRLSHLASPHCHVRLRRTTCLAQLPPRTMIPVL